MKKALLPLALASAMFAGSASAVVFEDFQVDPDMASPGTYFTADKITGNYVEIATFTAATATTGSFTTSIKWEAGQFVMNDGTLPIAAGTTRLGVDYGLYAILMGSGTYSVSGTGVTTFTFAPGGSLNVYFDDDVDTLLTAPATGNATWTGTDADDILLATGAVISGQGQLNPALTTCQNGGINCGSFGVKTSFALETLGAPDGDEFFIWPVPFYPFAFDSGQLNNFTVPTSGVDTQSINGSLDVVFQRVPEPSTIALLGLGLTGLGLSLRRRKTA